MKKQKILSFILAFTLIFTIFTVAASAKIERYDLTSDQISYREIALTHVKKIINSVYGNTFSLYQADDRTTDYDQFLRYATYYLRKDFIDSPVEKCEYDIVLNDISDYNNGKALHFTVTSDIYTENSAQPTVKELDIFVKISYELKVMIVSDIYIAEESLESVISTENEPMTLEKFIDWAYETNEEEYAALVEKLKPETAEIIQYFEVDIFKDIYHNQNENVTVKNSNAVEAFELAQNFLNDYIACISERKTLETDVPMASETVARYLSAMTKYYGKYQNTYYSGADFEFNYLDGYVYENNVYLEVQVLKSGSSDVVYFRFIEQEDGTLAIANYCQIINSFDTMVFDWNNYGAKIWMDCYIQDFKTVDYAEVIDRAEQIAENGYFESDKKIALNNSAVEATPPEPATQPENEFLSNPATADISLIFYALAIISAVFSCITFKKKA